MEKIAASRKPAAWAGLVLLLILILLVGLRAALPAWILHQVNRPPAEQARYRWEVQDVDIHLLSRSYEFEGVALVQREESDSLFTAERIRSTFPWRNPFTGPVPVDMEAFHPRLELELAPGGRSPNADPPDWEKVLEKLTLRRVSSFSIHDGKVRLRDAKSRPQVTLSASGVDIRADYLYRVGTDSARWAGLKAEGLFMESGRFMLKTRLDPEAARPTFVLDFSMRGLELKSINSALMAYAGMEVEKGRLDLETHATASGGRYQGRIRSGLDDFELADTRPKDEGMMKALGRKVTGVLGNVLEWKTESNEAEGKGLPKADFSGEFPKEVVDAWSMSEFLLKEAFRKGLQP